MKNIIIKILPPFLFQILNNLRRRILFTENKLFDGNDNLYKEHIKKCRIYGEYGVGKTTNWVLRNTNCKIVCVDSSSQWINLVKGKISDSDMKRVKFKWYDLGEIGEWGNPLSYYKHQNIAKYIDSIWTENIKPDLVLIDGRFRIACFLKCLLESEKNTKIIFDDYTNRKIYHVVEQIIKPSEIYKRQALFVKTEDLDIKLIKNLYSKFEYVMY
tara:strand:- start:1104 stop:1745 length:642 start_codon:yes stop_codon:yes gene_type:complete